MAPLLAHWDPGTPTCTLGPHGTSTCTLRAWDSYLHIGPHGTLTTTLRPQDSFQHTGKSVTLLPAHWDLRVLPASWDPKVLLSVHWDPRTPSYTLGPHGTLTSTVRSWDSCLHAGTPWPSCQHIESLGLFSAYRDIVTCLTAHWNPGKLTYTLGHHGTYLHIETPSPLPAHWDTVVLLPLH